MLAFRGRLVLLKKRISQKFLGVEKLLLVGDVASFSNAKMVVIFEDTCRPSEICQTTRYCGLQSINKPTKICLTSHNLVIYMI
jgi:hypothetical protein